MQYHKVERGIIPMKNSDMKVIAIILSIALFFTIVTSNAVSVVSVITLLKDGGTTVAADGTQTGDNAMGFIFVAVASLILMAFILAPKKEEFKNRSLF